MSEAQQAVRIVRAADEALAVWVEQHPDRFVALSSVVLPYPDLAAVFAAAAGPAAAQEGSADLVQRALPNPNPEVALSGRAARRPDVGLDRRHRRRPG